MSYDGGKISLLREAKGWSMAELARRARISQPSLWALEHQLTKKPKADTLLSISAALGVQMRELLRPSKATPADQLEEITTIFDRLDSRNRAALIAAARALRESQK